MADGEHNKKERFSEIVASWSWKYIIYQLLMFVIMSVFVLGSWYVTTSMGMPTVAAIMLTAVVFPVLYAATIVLMGMSSIGFVERQIREGKLIEVKDPDKWLRRQEGHPKPGMKT